MNSGNFCKMSRDSLKASGSFAPGAQQPFQPQQAKPIIVITTSSVDGHGVTGYCRVFAEDGVSTDLFAAIRDLYNRCSSTYEKKAQNARELALQGLRGCSRICDVKLRRPHATRCMAPKASGHTICWPAGSDIRRHGKNRQHRTEPFQPPRRDSVDEI
jgi:hypothetical protein